jgi:hypothetical protein
VSFSASATDEIAPFDRESLHCRRSDARPFQTGARVPLPRGVCFTRICPTPRGRLFQRTMNHEKSDLRPYICGAAMSAFTLVEFAAKLIAAEAEMKVVDAEVIRRACEMVCAAARDMIGVSATWLARFERRDTGSQNREYAPARIWRNEGQRCVEF